jgi:dienelactone hydrolase
VEDLLRWENWLADAHGVGALAVAGLSYGGDLSLTYPVFSARVERIFCSGASGTFALHYGRCHNAPAHCVPGLLNWLERADIAGLNAPRPLVIHYGERDTPLKQDGRIRNLAAAFNEGVPELLRETQAIYAAAGAPGKVRLSVTPGAGHIMDVEELLRFLEEN